MSTPELETLRARLEDSPTLRELHQQLEQEVGFRAAPSVEFNPLLIISIISLTIQVIQWCQARNTSNDEIRAKMRDLSSVPYRQMMRFRRKLNELWRQQTGTAPGKTNPLIDAVFTLSDSASDEALDELLWLADRGASGPV